MPGTGPSRKRSRTSTTPAIGTNAPAEHTYNAIEFLKTRSRTEPHVFVGFIERCDHVPARRVSLFASTRPHVGIESFLQRLARATSNAPRTSMAYPAIFFEDPSGTKLELVARAPRVLELAG